MTQSDSGYVRIVDMAEPAAPEMAWPSAGRPGPRASAAASSPSCSISR